MAKVVAVFKKEGKNGTYFEHAIDGLEMPARSKTKYEVGTEIPDANLKLNDQKDGYWIEGEGRGRGGRGGGGSFDREASQAQTVFNSLTALAVAGQVHLFKDNGAFDSENATRLGVAMAKTINAITKELKAGAPAAGAAPGNGQKPGGQANPPLEMKTVGDLLTRAYRVHGLSRNDTCQILGIQDPAQIADLNEAWTRIEVYMGVPK